MSGTTYIHDMNERRLPPNSGPLQSLDLNLLRVFEALLAEGNVTRAAERLGRSQPAVSNALTRLRTTLGDPLFVRNRGGIAPTARALALAGPLRDALALLRSALEKPVAFDPASSRRTFVIAASDHAQLLVVPPLAGQLSRWPSVRFRFVPLPRDFPSSELERGDLDLVLGVFDLATGDRAPSGLKRQLLVEERLVALGRKGNPALRRDLRRNRDLAMLTVSPRGGTRGALARRFVGAWTERVTLQVPHYLVAPWILASTDQVALLPERVASRFCEAFPLERRALSWLPGTLRVQQLWHPRADAQPAHQWLRRQVLEGARSAPA